MKVQKYAKYLGVIALAVGLATACSSTETSSGNIDGMADKNAQMVQQSIADARTALAAAEKGGYAWRDNGKFITQAEKALADGNIAKASALASKALEQSELAKKQSIEQDRAVKERFNQS
ncbi:MAG: hypothetical protein QNL62_17820 [Gammaproteobacteria bacterium]|nr:hypothetical protein [Gammaproteobacteria bacterium]